MTKIEPKYIKCFSEEKKNQLIQFGVEFLYEQHGVYYFKKPEVRFSNQDILKDTKTSLTVNF
jgi:hypothetical protein